MKMNFYIFIFPIIFTLGSCTDEDIVNHETTIKENERELTVLDREGLTMVQMSEKNNEWVPQVQPQEYKVIRRRLRKRKKRPHRVRPYSRETQTRWDEMGGNDEPNRPYMRRQIHKSFTREESSEDHQEAISELITERGQETPTFQKQSSTSAQNQDPHNHISNLKSILKQAAGTLSLSEILQQKNLSLTELLKGNEKALLSLNEKPLSTTENIINKKTIGVEEKQNSKAFWETDETKKIYGINKLTVNENDYLGQPSYESTTEKRIFVPSHPKYYTSLNFKPDLTPFFNENSENSAIENPEIDKSRTNMSCFDNHKVSTIHSNLKENSNNNSEFQKHYKIEKDNLKPIKINLPEVMGYQNIKTLETVIKKNLSGKETDKPMRVSIARDVTLTEKEIKTTTQIPIENNIYVTARDEIMEVLKDPASRVKLSKILQLRNMTLAELVQQRERGSSQVHLADIFHNKSREPEPKEEIFVGHVDHISLQSDRQQKSTRFEYEQDIQKHIPEQPTMQNKSDFFEVQTTNIQTVTMEPLYDDIYLQKNEKIKMVNISNSTDQFSNINSLESLKETFDLFSKQKFEVKKVFSDDDFFLKLPSGVKSAIFASLAIIGLSIVIFLTILMIFKWSTLKNRKSNYCNSLTSTFRAPILQRGSTAAIKSFVSETLGRRKTYHKNNVQRMCEDIWESDKERKLSF